MKRLALLLISSYQGYLSPHKGYCCAYRTLYGRSSCSHFGYRAISRYGILMGIFLLKRRLSKCAAAFQAIGPQRTQVRGLRLQRGHCDLPIGDCHPGHDGDGACLSDSLNGLPYDGSCDFLRRKHRKSSRRGSVTIHPDASSRTPRWLGEGFLTTRWSGRDRE
jgi:uncharacterized protein